MNKVYDAVVVGSGPNGLASAIALARAGLSVVLIEAKEEAGGGIRSASLTLPGFIHDICAAVHPMGITSPFFKSLLLEQYGLNWINPPAPLAHPLQGGTAITLERSIQATARQLGEDAVEYTSMISPVVLNWDNLLQQVYKLPCLPSMPFALAAFGLHARLSINQFTSHFKTPAARAFMAGILAHATMPTHWSWAGSLGLMLAAAGHRGGWPISEGGSQQIARSLSVAFASMGGETITGLEVKSLTQLPVTKIKMFDVTPAQFGRIAAARLKDEDRRRYLSYRYGPGVFKIDWALSAPVPWAAESCLRSATVHIGSSYEEIATAENAVWRGEHPENPFIIFCQPSLFDPGRAPQGKHTAWAYCHVPHGSTVDMTERIENQVERFAPGFRGLILARAVKNTVEMQAYNPNYIGGDINAGEQQPLTRLFRPAGFWKPYATPLKGTYICSSAMPPGPGVHGMCGYNAAMLAIREARF